MILLLVHIGDIFPEYMNICIKQIQSVSNIPIHVLVSKKHETKIISNVTVVSIETIEKSEKHTYFENNSKLNSSFRDGFWKYAMLRFFYIYDYISSKSIKDVFHIEYDNLIYQDFTKYISMFQSRQMWCVMDSNTRCIPSFLYFKNNEIVSLLLDTCLEHAVKGNNDMQALADFYHKHKKEVGSLPISVNYIDRIDPIFYEHAETFQCLFDGAAVGQYIGGVDPRNISGNTEGFINEETVIKCNKMTVEWKEKKPYLNSFPLVNLHIHSKNLKKWANIE